MKNFLTLLFTLISLFLSAFAHAQEEFLEPDAAFAMKHKMVNNQLQLTWKIAPGYYMYQDKIKINGTPVDKKLLPKAELKNDPVFGDVWVYKYLIEASLPTNQMTDSIKLEWQGCAEAGLCYPPQRATISIPASNKITTPESNAEPTPTPITSQTQATKDELSESDQIASMFANSNIFITIAFFFGVGLLLAFTPCVFPMIPILSSIIVGQGEGITTKRAFTMSLVYVLAMALTYTAAGVLAGLFGANLQAAFQNPWILGIFSAIFVALAMSMFGFYELQLPASLQAKLAEYSNQQQGGTLTGVAIMGLLSALIVGPCVAPPLAGALIYIGQTGDAFLGGAALFALSMGMGVPLLLIGTAAGKYMPKAGGWMDQVKAVFGVSLLAVAIWMLDRVLPGQISMLLWAALLLASAVYLGAFETADAGWQKLWKSLGLLLAIWSALLLIGLASGSKSPLTPLAHLMNTSTNQNTTNNKIVFQSVKSLNELNAALNQAKTQGKTVMLDFYADWCVSCKEMEAFTFHDAKVKPMLDQMLLIQADITDNNNEHKALLKEFGLVGPPAILFFDPNGREMRALRVVGFMKPEPFAQQLDKALNPKQ